MSESLPPDRYRAGIGTMLGIAPGRADLVSDELAEVAPDFVRLLVEFAFGDVLARRGLDMRARALVAIGALAAQGRSLGPLRYFVRVALHAGCSRGEVVEALTEVGLFAGFPAAAGALEACSDLLLAHPAEPGCCPRQSAQR